MFQKKPIIAYKGIQIKNFFGIALKILFLEHIVFGFAECIVSRFEVFVNGKWELFAKGCIPKHSTKSMIWMFLTFRKLIYVID